MLDVYEADYMKDVKYKKTKEEEEADKQEGCFAPKASKTPFVLKKKIKLVSEGENKMEWFIVKDGKDEAGPFGDPMTANKHMSEWKSKHPEHEHDKCKLVSRPVK